MPTSKRRLKARVCQAIDRRADEIVAIGEAIWRNPEIGYKEVKTAELVASKLEALGLDCERGIGLTGVLAKIRGRRKRPNIAALGELDCLVIPEHPEADPATGAVHACGHHAQVANMLGLAFGLVDADVMSELDGSVTLMAVPSEEPLDIEWRQLMRQQGKLHFLGGKQEFIHEGYFRDVDIALMDHMAINPKHRISAGIPKQPGPGMDGFLAKLIRFSGREAHAGVAPEDGVNALNAAMLGLLGIHAQRETFRGQDSIRVHQIISSGGDSVNVVPADVTVEMMVRGATLEAIKEASAKVDRALRAGAMATGASVEIQDIPGYLPSAPAGSVSLAKALAANMAALVGADQVDTGSDTIPRVKVPSGGVSDGNDVANIMPIASMLVNAAEGSLHGRDFRTADKELAYVVPAKGWAMTIIDLLYDGAALARKALSEYRPPIAKKAYAEVWRGIVGGE